jgi:dipeptidyl aminopeptidase/acylaminoacyl peptidase
VAARLFYGGGIIMRLRTGAALAAVAAAGAALPAAAHAAYPGANGRIFFTSARDGVDARSDPPFAGRPEVYSMRPDGTGKTRLTFDHAYEADPAASPDGSRLAFVRSGGLYLMAAGGGLPVRVATARGYVFSPTWSPDGRQLAYEVDGRIHVVRTDGSGDRELVRGSSPAWSPRGDAIAFSGKAGISVVDPEGGNQRLVSSQLRADPEWAPDGTRIAGSAHSATATVGSNSEIWVVNADGSGAAQLTSLNNSHTELFVRFPAWSPDGGQIAFSTAITEGEIGVQVMNADGSHVRTPAGGPSAQPDWAPATGADCSGVRPSKRVLTTVDGRLHQVFLRGGQGLELEVTGVTQDEVVGADPDALRGQYSHEVWLRAQRSRRGNGRFYRIAFRGTDASGSCTGLAKVTVRRKPGRAARETARTYNSLQPTG